MTDRPASTLAKLDRMRKALRHEEPDRVPVSDFFWGSFVERWRRELGLPPDADPYSYYDLDWIVTIPNMDPHLRSFAIVRESQNEVWVKTGFETVLRKRLDLPMPEQISWDTDTIEKLEAFEFDDPGDPRRFFDAGDNQIAGVGDGFQRNSPPWIETVRRLRRDFPVFGSMIEASECLTRLVGQHNALLWMGLYPQRMGACIRRISEFYLHCCRAALEAAAGTLDGFVLWGDVAYRKGLFFAPDYWREHFKPWVEAMVNCCHAHGLPVIYHGCGNVSAIFDDYVEIGIDAYNPLEVKAGMDVVELRRRYGHRIGFCGNLNVQAWERGDRREIRAEILRKLQAGRGGGLILQSDHSVTSGVSGRTYEYIVNLIRERGVYPLTDPQAS
jgi:uroporphyrinogen decarboxylase